MPSVRVRRSSQYASLRGEDGSRDDIHRRPRSRTLASIYQPPGQTGYESSQSEGPSASSGGQEGPDVDTSHENNGTYGKIAESILYGAGSGPSGQRRYTSREGLNDERARSLESENRRRDGTVMFEGSQAEIVVPDDGKGPGILESTLSLSSDENNPFHSGDHEDDIVEHLDVIDPEIATISNLANAANAILIPPIGIYSRKPVVFLPRVPLHVDAERGSAYEDDLDRHVEEVLSKRAKIRRILRGVWAFVKTPLGMIAAFYGFCVVFWGAAIVFFLARFINLHNPLQQGFWVEVSSQVENALFTVTGIGLIPWRVVDTYRILRIWHYKRLTRKLRKKAKLPELFDEDDLPDPTYDPNYVHVLSEEQEKELHHQQRQFAKSQTWYRPHGTTTHRAFPIETALTICCCNDGNSIFQIVLCGTMWGLNRFQRPAWSTGILIPASFLCGIASAIFIWRGGQKTKRTKEVEEKLRLALKIERNPEKYKVVEVKNSGTPRSPLRHTSSGNENEHRDAPKSPKRNGDEMDRRPRENPSNDDRDSSASIDEKMEVPLPDSSR